MKIRSMKILGFTILALGLALCGVGLWLLLSPAQYQALVRIKIERDLNNAGAEASYDPYFIQTEFEVIQSEAVLGKVVAALNLNVEWGKKYAGGNNLKTVEAINLLKRQMSLSPIRNTKLIEIHVTNENPNEAAKIANAIAKAYHDYRVEQWQQQVSAGIKVLEEQFQKEEQDIKIEQEKVEQLEKALQDPVPSMQTSFNHTRLGDHTNDRPADTNDMAYLKAARELVNMVDLHKLHAMKIEVEKVNFNMPKTSMVQIVDVAEPPKSPVIPDRFLGASLLICGLVTSAFGFYLFSNRRVA